MQDDAQDTLAAFLPFDLPPSSRARQVFERREIRYRVADPGTIVADLAAICPPSSYTVRTLYLGKSAGYRIRLRAYDGSDHWWLERKQRSGEDVSKERWAVGSVPLDLIRPVGAVRYTRLAFDLGGGRITVDTRVADGLDRQLVGTVVEVKGSLGAEIDLPTPDDSFSKFRFVTGRVSD